MVELLKKPMTRRDFIGKCGTVFGLAAFSKFASKCTNPTSVEKLIDTVTFYKDKSAALGQFTLTLRSIQITSTAKRAKSATIDLLKSDGTLDRTLVLELNDSVVLDDPADPTAKSKYKIVCSKLPDFDSSTEMVGLTLYSYKEIS